ncbi:MAG TPA: VOC family protein [Methylomirabilota bacterium]|nr:VOC family protein [Methylomirabilota bacterium]
MPEILFDHIAIAVKRMADAPPVLSGVLGGTPDEGGPSSVYRFGQWRFKGGGRLEILEPIGTDGFLHRFLRERGPGVHHVTFRVSSLAAACDRARAEGYVIVGYDDSEPDWKEAFLHPREALGIVVQLAESRFAAGEGGRRRWAAPAGPRNPPPPVTIVGLRMGARSRQRAQRQWERVLGARSTEGSNGELIYRWPGSPMRVTVEIDASAAEGAIAVEYSSDRPVALPDGRHPVLGTAFVAVRP